MALERLLSVLSLSRLMVLALGTVVPFSMMPAFTLAQSGTAVEESGEAGAGEEDWEEEGGEMAMMGYRVRKADMEFLAKRVGLSEDQKAQAMELFTAYDQSSRDAMQKLREFREDAEAAAGDEMNVDRRNLELEAYEKMSAQRDKLREGLIADLRLMLDPSQEEKFLGFERRLRRADVMGRMQFGSASGSAADLVGMVERVTRNKDLSAGAMEAVVAYEVEMDKVATDYGNWMKVTIEDVMKKMRQAEGGMPDEEMMQDFMKLAIDGMRRSVPMRDVNVRFVSRIAGELEAGDAEALEDTFYRDAFVDRFRFQGRGGGRVSGAMDQALKVPDLDDEQKAKLEDVRVNHAKRSLDIMKETARLTMSSEDKKLADPDANMMSFFGGMEDEGMQELETKRQELDNQTVEKIREALRPEQIEKLGPPLGKNEIEDIDFDDEE